MAIIPPARTRTNDLTPLVLIEHGRGGLWVVEQGDVRLEGRAPLPLVEALLGRGDPAVLRLTIDALGASVDHFAPLRRDTDAGE
jgi:hypothetical protein